MNLATIFKLFIIYNNLLYLMEGSSSTNHNHNHPPPRKKRHLLSQARQIMPMNPMMGLMMLLPLLPLAMRKSRSLAVLLPVPVPMRNQQQPPPTFIKERGNGDLMLMMMMMMSMMKNMDGKPSNPWGPPPTSNWPPPPSGNPWPSQPAKDPWPTTAAPVVKDPWPSPVKDPWPSPVKDPWPSPVKDPWPTTTPAPDPWATKPSNPWETKPSDPWATKPSNPWDQTKPSNPWDQVKGGGGGGGGGGYPWDQNKGSNPWDQGNKNGGGGNPWDQAKQSGNPWDQAKQSGNPWDQGNKNGASGNPFDQLFKPTNPWDPAVEDAKRKLAADFGLGFGDMNSAQYAAMMAKMAEMLKYYMKNMSTTPAPGAAVPAEGGKIEDCPKCNVQVNINNSNASPKHNQTQTTSYGVKKRSKESKVKGSKPGAADSGAAPGEAPPPEDGDAPLPDEIGAPVGEPIGDPNDPDGGDPDLIDDPTMDGIVGGGGGVVDLDGDGFPDPPARQFTRYGQQKQQLAKKRKDKVARRRRPLRGHTLGSPVILPHEPYNGVRYAVPRTQTGRHLTLPRHYSPSPPAISSFSPPLNGQPVLLQSPQSPALLTPAMIPIVSQPVYSDKGLIYAQALPIDNYGQTQHQPIMQTANSKTSQAAAFIPVQQPVDSPNSLRSSNGYFNPSDPKMTQTDLRSHYHHQHPQLTNQVDNSPRYVKNGLNPQREADYFNDSPLLTGRVTEQGTTALFEDYNQYGVSNNEMDDAIVITKPALGKPPPIHKTPIEFKGFNNDKPSQPSSTAADKLDSTTDYQLTESQPSSPTQPPSAPAPSSSASSPTTTTTIEPVYIQQRSSMDESQEVLIESGKEMNKIIREPPPSPSASQPKPRSSTYSTPITTPLVPYGKREDNFRANGPSPSPLSTPISSPEFGTIDSTSKFRTDVRSKRFRSDFINPSSSNEVKSPIVLSPSSSSSTSSLPSQFYNSDSSNGTLSSSNSKPNLFYSFPLSIESESSSESGFPILSKFSANPFWATLSARNGSQLVEKSENYDSFVDQKMDDRIAQENGTHFWKEISNNLNAINGSGYYPGHYTQSDSTFPTPIYTGSLIDYDKVNHVNKTNVD